MAVHGQRREPIGDDDGQVDATRVGVGVIAQLPGRVRVQLPAQIGALQIAVAVGGGAVQEQAGAAAITQLLAQARVVERQVHGIAGLGVGVL
ncbi:hypothetical protein D3C78_1769990 [compost metagenome]